MQADVLDADAVAETIRGATHIVHLAAIAGVDTVLESPVRTMRVNLIGTYNVLEAAHATQQTVERLVDFSTSEVFGRHAYKVEEIHETAQGSVGEARWTYAVSKLAGEHLAHSYYDEFGLPTCSLRPFNVYGPGQIGGGAIRAFIETILAGDDLVIHGDGSQIRAWCYVDDLVDALLLVLERPEAVGEVYNIGNPRSVVTVYDLAARIRRLMGADSQITFRPLHYTDVEMRIPNIDKAREGAGLGAAGRPRRGALEDDRVVPGTPTGTGVIRLAWPDLGEEELAAVAEVLESGQLTMGPEGGRVRGRARGGLRRRGRSRSSPPARRRSIWPCSRSGSGLATRSSFPPTRSLRPPTSSPSPAHGRCSSTSTPRR